MLNPPLMLLIASAMAMSDLPSATAAAASAPRAKPPAKAPAAKSSKSVKLSKTAPAPDPVLPLTEGQIAVGERVMQGQIACEMEQSVRIDPTPNHPGHFTLTHNKLRYAVVPQETVSGAVRLEDANGEVVWIQIPAKSMLLNVKRGQRIADNCLHEQQRSFVADASSSLGIETPSAPAVALVTPLLEPPPIMAAYGTCWLRKAQTWWQVESVVLVGGETDPRSKAVPEPASALGAMAWGPSDSCQFTVWDVPLVAAVLVTVELDLALDCAESMDSSRIGSACASSMVEGRTPVP